MNHYKGGTVVTVENVRKVIVRISRKQLWMNFIENWSNCAWDDFGNPSYEGLKEVGNALLNGDKLSSSQTASGIRKLFKDGDTVLLLGDAMVDLEQKDILREVIVQDINDVTGDIIDEIKIEHNHIIF